MLPQEKLKGFPFSKKEPLKKIYTQFVLAGVKTYPGGISPFVLNNRPMVGS